jgi:hypothetical protein
MRKNLIVLRREAAPDRVLSDLFVYAGISQQAKMAVLELSWKGNARKVSCIPAGQYIITPEEHPTKGKVFRLSHVDGRSGILVHRGNSPADTEGCLILGMRFADLDADGIFEVSQSAHAMEILWQLVPEEADLFIFDATGGHNG